LRAFSRAYFPVTDGVPSKRLQDRVVAKYVDVVVTADIASSTRGFTLALGALPAKLAAFDGATLDLVLGTLMRASRADFKVGDEPDAETRRNALAGLVELCATVGVGNEGGLTARHVGLVFETLLLATKDYSMDKRGDVGSWSRVAAMAGLEHLADLAIAANTHPAPHTSADADCAVPSEAERTALLALPPAPPAASAAASAAAPEPYYENAWGLGGGVFFSASMVEALLCVVLKQLCEKLDNVRAKAGGLIERILSKPKGVGATHWPIPCRAQLEALLLPAEGQPANNWAVASETFPKMVGVMGLGLYHDAVVAGLVLSVGGLTEAVVKSSSAALLDWCKGSAATSRGGSGAPPAALVKLTAKLQGLFGDHAGDDRVVLPLMKTVELLLNAEVLNFLSESPAPNFGTGVLALVKAELARSTNVVKLFTGLNIGLSLLHVAGAVRYGAMTLVLELLGHRYPRVRKHAAEQFYEKLLVDDRPVAPAVYDHVLDMLRATVWDADTGAVRAERDAIASAVEVTLERRADGDGKQKAKPKADALDSYQHLVDEVGY
jgi:hypothetical protein